MPASVDSKALTQGLSPLDATLMKNKGGGALSRSYENQWGQAFLPVSANNGFPLESISYEMFFL